MSCFEKLFYGLLILAFIQGVQSPIEDESISFCGYFKKSMNNFLSMARPVSDVETNYQETMNEFLEKNIQLTSPEIKKKLTKAVSSKMFFKELKTAYSCYQKMILAEACVSAQTMIAQTPTHDTFRQTCFILNYQKSKILYQQSIDALLVALEKESYPYE